MRLWNIKKGSCVIRRCDNNEVCQLSTIGQIPIISKNTVNPAFFVSVQMSSIFHIQGELNRVIFLE